MNFSTQHLTFYYNDKTVYAEILLREGELIICYETRENIW
jgi:hypothetical protein